MKDGGVSVRVPGKTQGRSSAGEAENASPMFSGQVGKAPKAGGSVGQAGRQGG